MSAHYSKDNSVDAEAEADDLTSNIGNGAVKSEFESAANCTVKVAQTSQLHNNSSANGEVSSCGELTLAEFCVLLDTWFSSVGQLSFEQKLYLVAEEFSFNRDQNKVDNSSKKLISGFQMKSADTDNGDFCLDSSPLPLIEASEKVVVQPIYKVSDSLCVTPLSGSIGLALDANANSARPQRAKNTCYNCDKEDHGIKDCPDPLDQSKIRSRRSLKRQSIETRSRYHATEDSRFGSFKAGVVSDNLRAALGLGKNELPPWIYQMRIYGMPPAYEAAARIQPSVITVYDSHEAVDKEGADESASAQTKVNYFDPDAVPDWPGFNVPLPLGVVDRNTPAMNVLHSKKESLRAHLANQQSGIAALEESPKPSQKRLCPETEESTVAVKKMKILENNVVVADESFLEQSECILIDAEQNTSQDFAECSGSSISMLSSSDAISRLVGSQKSASSNGAIVLPSSASSFSTPVAAAEKAFSHSLSFEYSTPSLASDSPYSKVVRTPALSRFSEGIQPFVPKEENPPLPNKGFQVLRGIVKSIKTTFANKRE